MSMTDITTSEHRIAERINSTVTGELAVSNAAGGLAFVNMNQAMEFAKMMAISSVAVPKHLRANPGACLAVVIQAIEWKLSPYAVANKSYSVNDRLAYESQLIQAVILQRAPIVGRFKVEYTGEGEGRVCRVWARLKDGEETVEYISPPFGKITPKNSPLWKSDPDQQQFYYSGRALCRRHFPDVLLGVYVDDEISPPGPDNARDVTPSKSIGDKLDALAGLPTSSSPSIVEHTDAETGEVTETNSAASAATGEKSGDATGAGQADTDPTGSHPDKASPAKASTQKDAHPGPSDASGQAASDASGPSRSKDKDAAKAGDKADPPKNEGEYIAYAKSWIDRLDDAAKADALWKADKNLRNKANVSEEVREDLKKHLDTKVREIQDADRS